MLGPLSFEDIWNGDAWTALRREHLAGRRASAPYFHECAWCYKNRHVDCEDIVEPACEGRRLLIQDRPAHLPDVPAHARTERGRMVLALGPGVR
jgi:hypothetical protein